VAAYVVNLYGEQAIDKSRLWRYYSKCAADSRERWA